MKVCGIVTILFASVAVGAVQEISIGPEFDGHLNVVGADARPQLMVTASDGSRDVDVTRNANYQVKPEGVLSVAADGLITPLGDGTAEVIATVDGKTSSLKVHVSDFENNRAVNFKNEIVPIFTKLSCNSGGCHGKASGQNGFRLSLLGFYPEDDYEFLVKETRGRRIFPPAPDQSLLLAKAIGNSPHGGGKRMEKDSYEYKMVRRWISQGMPYGQEDDPVVTKIECIPAGRIMDQNTSQQITVYATYSDGHREDVTRMALFEPNDTELAEVNETGLVTTLDLSGEVAVMARYQGQVATYRATIPLGVEVAETPPVRNFIDEAVFGKLQLLGIPPSELCSDSTFLRRVYLDITGTLQRQKK